MNDFRQAINTVIAELTPQPWEYTTPDGTTLTVIPAGLREEPGCAEVNIRVTTPDVTGLAEFGITTNRTRGAAQIGITTTALPALIRALDQSASWEGVTLGMDAVAVTITGDGVHLAVTEVHYGPRREETATIFLPAAQRQPLASALRRAGDVASGWEG